MNEKLRKILKGAFESNVKSGTPEQNLRSVYVTMLEMYNINIQKLVNSGYLSEINFDKSGGVGIALRLEGGLFHKKPAVNKIVIVPIEKPLTRYVIRIPTDGVFCLEVHKCIYESAPGVESEEETHIEVGSYKERIKMGIFYDKDHKDITFSKGIMNPDSIYNVFDASTEILTLILVDIIGSQMYDFDIMKGAKK